MKTQQNIKKIRVQVLKAATKEIDPETLWFDTDIEPESLIEDDPLEISQEIIELAEQPELSDFWLMSLPSRQWGLRAAARELKMMKSELHGEKESPEAFVRRLQEEGSS